MLYIVDKQNRNIPWHIGESFPMLTGHVISFQADGDELLVILDAVKRASRQPENSLSTKPAETLEPRGIKSCPKNRESASV